MGASAIFRTPESAQGVRICVQLIIHVRGISLSSETNTQKKKKKKKKMQAHGKASQMCACARACAHYERGARNATLLANDSLADLRSAV